MPPKKDRKVPCDVNGAATDPHDRTKFMTYEEASTVAGSTGYNVGFVLTKNDPYFLFDLDDVRDPVSTQTSHKPPWRCSLALRWKSATLRPECTCMGAVTPNAYACFQCLGFLNALFCTEPD